MRGTQTKKNPALNRRGKDGWSPVKRRCSRSALEEASANCAVPVEVGGSQVPMWGPWALAGQSACKEVQLDLTSVHRKRNNPNLKDSSSRVDTRWPPSFKKMSDSLFVVTLDFLDIADAGALELVEFYTAALYSLVCNKTGIYFF